MEGVLEEIDAMLGEQQSVSARWYARRADLPVDEARALLKSYLSARAGSASGVFLVSGEAASGGRVVRLAEADELERTRAGFASVTTEQLYSVHAPALASDASRKYEPLASLAAAQDAQLYEEASGETNCLLDNRWAAIRPAH
ncbi:hypothetical protein EMIHUDRAFT_242333 [Emiliania huxleyi CCMP1516]|nr:hypothetical protein EMIHUDRAFT_242333 [Emiliania huxleyi CCMP1516]EOD20169.1 hypothetical protein EMIHUDRAFT_242333 [Emiliania huxleyi CCMP1516]|eukprot:XP_005772598.1 hypothetical protein EMIHUDRAFT_242333 [Emiliania huxleyi CCMP1516]